MRGPSHATGKAPVRNWRASAQTAAGLFFLAMIASYAWVAPATYRLAKRGYPDFSCFYTAGRMVGEGQGRRLYDPAAQTAMQKQFSEVAVIRNRALFYMHPPFEAILFLPFVRLAYPRAYLAWVAVNLLMIVAGAALARARIPELKSIPAWVYYAAFLAFCPIAYSLALGQDSGIVLLLFVGATICLARGHDFAAGGLLGLGLIKFQLVLPLVLLLLLKRRFRALAGFALVSAFLVAACAWIVGWNGLLRYPCFLWRLNQLQNTAQIFPDMMPNLRGLLEGWVKPPTPTPRLDVLVAALSFILLLWVARNWDTTAGSQVYLGGMTMALLGAVLSGYHTFVYDLSLLCPFLLLSIGRGMEDSRLNPRARNIMAVAAGALLCAPLYWVVIHLLGRLNVMALFLLALMCAWSSAIGCWKTESLLRNGAAMKTFA